MSFRGSCHFSRPIYGRALFTHERTPFLRLCALLARWRWKSGRGKERKKKIRLSLKRQRRRRRARQAPSDQVSLAVGLLLWALPQSVCLSFRQSACVWFVWQTKALQVKPVVSETLFRKAVRLSLPKTYFSLFFDQSNRNQVMHSMIVFSHRVCVSIPYSWGSRPIDEWNSWIANFVAPVKRIDLVRLVLFHVCMCSWSVVLSLLSAPQLASWCWTLCQNRQWLIPIIPLAVAVAPSAPALTADPRPVPASALVIPAAGWCPTSSSAPRTPCWTCVPGRWPSGSRSRGSRNAMTGSLSPSKSGSSTGRSRGMSGTSACTAARPRCRRSSTWCHPSTRGSSCWRMDAWEKSFKLVRKTILPNLFLWNRGLLLLQYPHTHIPPQSSSFDESSSHPWLRVEKERKPQNGKGRKVFQKEAEGSRKI